MGEGGQAAEAACPSDVQGAEAVSDQPSTDHLALISTLASTVRQFFGGFANLFRAVDDPRDPSKITYPLHSLAFAGVLMFLCRLGARRQVGLLLRNVPSAANFAAWFGVNAFPHGDTLDATFTRLRPDQVQDVVVSMTESLIRSKVLYPYRLLDRLFVVAVDGTGTIAYAHRHCAHCLTRTHDGNTTYYHNVLEAKLVTRNGFCFSMMSDFIENPGENPTKQDCELKAFYRLAARLKKRFPRLPILLTMDGLFAGGPTFALCRKLGWSFVIVLKDDSLPSVNEEFQSLSKLHPENKLKWRTGTEASTHQAFRWVNGISYVDTNKKEHELSVLECLETKPDKGGERKTTKFCWVTNLSVSPGNVTAIANDAGRIRWKVENEGFNVQKTGGYGLEHGYSTDVTSSKVFYFLLQIAHLIAQLMSKGNLLRRAFPTGFGSEKNLAFRLLEAWRNAVLTVQALDTWLQRRIQIRFDSS